jgi:hypothetical protein
MGLTPSGRREIRRPNPLSRGFVGVQGLAPLHPDWGTFGAGNAALLTVAFEANINNHSFNTRIETYNEQDRREREVPA